MRNCLCRGEHQPRSDHLRPHAGSRAQARSLPAAPAPAPTWSFPSPPSTRLHLAYGVPRGTRSRVGSPATRGGSSCPGEAPSPPPPLPASLLLAPTAHVPSAHRRAARRATFWGGGSSGLYPDNPIPPFKKKKQQQNCVSTRISSRWLFFALVLLPRRPHLTQRCSFPQSPVLRSVHGHHPGETLLVTRLVCGFSVSRGLCSPTPV